MTVSFNMVLSPADKVIYNQSEALMKRKAIKPTIFNSRMLELGLDLDHVANELKVSPRSIQRYLKEESIPLKKVRKLKDVLQINNEIAQRLYVTEPSRFNLEFRKKWNHKNIEMYSERFEELAGAIDFMFEMKTFDYSRLKATDISTLNPEDAADVIKNFFSITDTLNLDSMERSLLDNNIYTYYFPFSFLKTEEDEGDFDDLCCVTIFNQIDEKLYIIQNSERTEFQAKFDIVHELTHILLSNNFNGDEEAFCNKVASKFFIKENELKTRASIINMGSAEEVASTIIDLMDDYHVDFDHALILFNEYGYLNKEVKSDLWKKYHSTFKREQSPLFNLNNSLLDIFLHQSFNRTNAIIKKSFKAFLSNKITTRMASFLLGVPPRDLNQYRNEYVEALS
jgi:Zn-dependent peptidase ImmA (M78 family)/AraC-like DNA-binding protein